MAITLKIPRFVTIFTKQGMRLPDVRIESELLFGFDRIHLNGSDLFLLPGVLCGERGRDGRQWVRCWWYGPSFPFRFHLVGSVEYGHKQHPPDNDADEGFGRSCDLHDLVQGPHGHEDSGSPAMPAGYEKGQRRIEDKRIYVRVLAD